MEQVRVWEEKTVIPTYEIGEPEKNPMFIEKRVYQGSTGKVYPYPTIEKVSDIKVDKEYNAVYLENLYIKVMILPELGGRIQRAYDKTNDYDFVYYNRVIKPALVGLTGPWISGGIEFNWPQHHRPTTFLPVDYQLKEYEDGSKSVLINDVDQMYGTKGIAEFRIYPDKAYIEIRGQLYNRTSLPQTFLWWANPAVAVNENTQSVFPPDVHAVMDHGKRDVSRFPIATGVYYKHDYGEGVDISRYKNIPVPTSYMAAKSDYNFVGGYDYGEEAGILHVADHHIAPGKKQWTWGNGDFGKAWDRNLTDEDGPYIELMTGVYTDNQPDFTWLKPFEEKSFKQYFMPYKGIGYVKSATTEAAVNLEVENNQIIIQVYATGVFEGATVTVKNKEEVILEEKVKISPVELYKKELIIEVAKESDISIIVTYENKILVAYQPVEKEIEELPDPAEAAKDPEEIRTNEELLLIGLHIEQYRHATYLPDPYYLEGLKRDPGDSRINNAYGALLLRRGCFKKSESYFRKAIERLTWRNPNPYNSEAYYNLGLALMLQNQDAKAFDAFYKATWTSEQQEMSFFYLGVLAAKKGDYQNALEFLNKSLIKNSQNIKARGVKAAVLKKLGKGEEAGKWIVANLVADPFDYVSWHENYLITGNKDILVKMNGLMRNFYENYLQTSRDYAEAGFYEEAIAVLKQCSECRPMLKYYEGYYLGLMGEEVKALEAVKEAECRQTDFTFPNKLEDILVLQYAITINPLGARAYYYLGNLYYDKLQYEEAKALWEKSVELDGSFPTVFRNLSLVYYNKCGEAQKAKAVMEKAFTLDTVDARIFLELDQLYKKLGLCAKERLDLYHKYTETFSKRDDLCVEYVSLLNMNGSHKEAYDYIMSRKFHPWEGGEGKITAQYTIALLELAKAEIKAENYARAKNYLEKILVYPENLGEGKLEGTKDNDAYYYFGIVYEKLGDIKRAEECYCKATLGEGEPAGVMYYNDQPADMILYQGLANLKLGRKSEAVSKFCKLINYGEKHIFDKVRIGYFAVSLPDFLIFEDDLDLRNKVHCYFLIGLGNIGLGRLEEAREYLGKTAKLDQNHLKGKLFAKDIDRNGGLLCSLL
jgi:tetratricopeptide (TPR) repeat protein